MVLVISMEARKPLVKYKHTRRDRSVGRISAGSATSTDCPAEEVGGCGLGWRYSTFRRLHFGSTGANFHIRDFVYRVYWVSPKGAHRGKPYWPNAKGGIPDARCPTWGGEGELPAPRQDLKLIRKSLIFAAINSNVVFFTISIGRVPTGLWGQYLLLGLKGRVKQTYRRAIISIGAEAMRRGKWETWGYGGGTDWLNHGGSKESWPT